jgi:pyruvate/2-oxoglutarate dehydrogenase complex dihydrolipoamide dehydrogenase (E3) component
MAERLNVDICVIGGGSAGLVVAAGASQMGASVVLIEKGLMGGDCLNYGCVPSKALLAAGRMAALAARAPRFGITLGEPAIDFAAVQERVSGVVAAIAPADSVERFRGLGVHVIQDEAAFTGPDAVRAGETDIRARRFVIATGSRPAVPPVAGLDGVRFFTNETIFANTERPDHLVILGGGPIGMEMAQAHRDLGCAVTVIEMDAPLGREDPEVVDILLTQLRGRGITVAAGAKAVEAAVHGGGIALTVEEAGQRRTIVGSYLLVASGRAAAVAGLNLEAANVAYSAAGVRVDRRLRTTNRKIFAIGDVTGAQQFTHVASYHAGIVLRNILFRLPARVNENAIPRVTYTDPELAHVGMTEAEARAAVGRIGVLRWPLAENDRAQTEGDTGGLVKIIVGKRGRILGASILGAHAGDLIHPWVLAISAKLKLGTMAGAIVPYPTRSEISKRAAGSYYQPALTSARTKRIVRFLARFG